MQDRNGTNIGTVSLCFNVLYVLDVLDLWNVTCGHLWPWPLCIEMADSVDICSLLQLLGYIVHQASRSTFHQVVAARKRVTFLRVAVLWNAFIAATKLDSMEPNLCKAQLSHVIT